MKVAVIGSRNMEIKNLERYLPPGTTVILSGGEDGVDRCAREYALQNDIRFVEILPEYRLYGRAAPLERDKKIVRDSDLLVIFWDGENRDTYRAVEYAKSLDIPVRMYLGK